MVRNVNMGEAKLGAYVYLKRGDSFDLDINFEYQGKAQNATFQLDMKQGLYGTKYSCGSKTGAVAAATAWEPRTAKFSFVVPSGVKDGSQDLQLHITAADGEHDESSWLTDCIWISV